MTKDHGDGGVFSFRNTNVPANDGIKMASAHTCIGYVGTAAIVMKIGVLTDVTHYAEHRVDDSVNGGILVRRKPQPISK